MTSGHAYIHSVYLPGLCSGNPLRESQIKVKFKVEK